MNKKFAVPLLLAAFVAVQAQAGFRYTLKTSFDGSHGGNSTVRMTADGAKARIEFVQGGPLQGGRYLLTQDGAKTLTLVSPEDKTYMKWDMTAMMGMAGAMTAMMKMEVTDPKIEKLLDEPGEPILGYPTRHYKFRISYGMSMNVMGFASSSAIVREEEAWATTRIDTAALGQWVKQAPRTMNDSLDKLIRAEMDKMPGVPLKLLAVQTTTDHQGKSQTVKTSMEITEIKELTPEASVFEIPAGYQEARMEAEENDSEGDGQSGPLPAGLPNLLKMLNP